jgi:hypothetical protein
MALFPPWTVTGGWENWGNLSGELNPQDTTTEFRPLFAKSKWEINGDVHGINEARIRFDILLVEMTVASICGAGVFLLAKKRS